MVKTRLKTGTVWTRLVSADSDEEAIAINAKHNAAYQSDPFWAETNPIVGVDCIDLRRER